MQPIEVTGHPGILASHHSDLATHLKILTATQILQRLPIVVAQIKTLNP